MCALLSTDPIGHTANKPPEDKRFSSWGKPKAGRVRQKWVTYSWIEYRGMRSKPAYMFRNWWWVRVERQIRNGQWRLSLQKGNVRRGLDKFGGGCGIGLHSTSMGAATILVLLPSAKWSHLRETHWACRGKTSTRAVICTPKTHHCTTSNASHLMPNRTPTRTPCSPTDQKRRTGRPRRQTLP